MRFRSSPVTVSRPTTVGRSRVPAVLAAVALVVAGWWTGAGVVRWVRGTPARPVLVAVVEPANHPGNHDSVSLDQSSLGADHDECRYGTAEVARGSTRVVITPRPGLRGRHLCEFDLADQQVRVVVAGEIGGGSVDMSQPGGSNP